MICEYWNIYCERYLVFVQYNGKKNTHSCFSGRH
jgi:hypothetical protein